MIISTIQFEIHNFINHTSEQFIIENTIENQEMVLQHRFTRQIKFVGMFDFQFEKEMRMPFEMIDYRVWLALLPLMEESEKEMRIGYHRISDDSVSSFIVRQYEMAAQMRELMNDSDVDTLWIRELDDTIVWIHPDGTSIEELQEALVDY